MQAGEELQSHYYNYIISKNMGDTGYGLRVRGESGRKKLVGFTTEVPFDAKPGEWIHVAAVLDGTDEKLYLNGALAGNRPYNKPMKVNNLPLWIGSSPFQGVTDWRGSIGEVRIWAVARTQEEIRATMFSHLRGDEAGLRACWPMDEGGGQKVTDLTGHTEPGEMGANSLAKHEPPIWVLRIDHEPTPHVNKESGLKATTTALQPSMNGIIFDASTDVTSEDIPLEFELEKAEWNEEYKLA